ncbi:MAG: hypothetical protein H7210_04885 [Pyrinomonadaceae bacterium]|nr:hypothetical protein [Phycisphaerales bacterium]
MPWYRSFRYYQNQPGLTTLTEIEVEHLVELAKNRREDALWVIPLLWNIALWIVVMVPVIWLALMMQRAGMPGTAWTVSAPGAKVIVALAACVMIVVSAEFWIWIRRLLIMRSIQFLINKATCPVCDFDLHGLRVADDAMVRCPECGEVILLKEHGLTRRDLSLEEAFIPPLPVSPLWHMDDGANARKEGKAPDRQASRTTEKPAQAAKGRSPASSGN